LLSVQKNQKRIRKHQGFKNKHSKKTIQQINKNQNLKKQLTMFLNLTGLLTMAQNLSKITFNIID